MALRPSTTSTTPSSPSVCKRSSKRRGPTAVGARRATSAITASGGSGNASIVAEVASWGDTH